MRLTTRPAARKILTNLRERGVVCVMFPVLQDKMAHYSTFFAPVQSSPVRSYSRRVEGAVVCQPERKGLELELEWKRMKGYP